MKQYSATLVIACLSITLSKAQSDVDVLRYSRTGAGGSSRFAAMGGAFGALGGDMSCASYNPAGLGIMRSGAIAYSGGLNFGSATTRLYNNTTSTPTANANFNHFGAAFVFTTSADPYSRHIFAFTINQQLNFSSNTVMSGYTSQSIAKDMTILANEKGNYSSLATNYEGLGYDTYLIDYDSTGRKYFSLVDPKQNVYQVRTIQTNGVLNDRNLSYAYSHKDIFYIGASVGFPVIRYESDMIHTESDDRDSMRVGITGPHTYTTSYVDGLPAVYADKLGFKGLQYEEYFKTTGTGLNLKIGGIVRVNDLLRLGMSYQSPTRYSMQDAYYNDLTVYFDGKPNDPEHLQDPSGWGQYQYVITTPARYGFNTAFIFGKKASAAVDYEMVDYSSASIQGSSAADFLDVNQVISHKYTRAHNIRAGTEINLQPFMLRAGYAMYGSPFGNIFSGNFVRHSVSIGGGLRTKGGFFLDLAIIKFITAENYYLFNALNTSTIVKQNNTQVSLTAGFRF